MLHRERGVECPLGVVLERDRSSERGHDRVSGELLEGPARPLDLLRHRLVEPLQTHADALWILLISEGGRAHDVGKEDRDELALLAVLHGGSVAALASRALEEVPVEEAFEAAVEVELRPGAEG